MIDLPALKGLLVSCLTPSARRLARVALPPAVVISFFVFLAVAPQIAGGLVVARVTAQAPAAAVMPNVLVGAWTLNVGLSDENPTLPGGRGEGRGRGSGGPPPGGGGGRGGHGGGYGGGGYGRGGRSGDPRGGDPEERMRQMNAVRDVLEAPDHLTITTTDSMVIVTAGDGRTSRLLLDGSAVKDETTHVERRTHWTAGKLVTDISGLVRGKITETYAVDPDTHRLLVTLQLENVPGQPPANKSDKGDKSDKSDKAATGEKSEKGRAIKRVYDADAR